MDYYAYILYSPSLEKFYKGSTNNLIDRLSRHNAGFEIATKNGEPWILLWSERCDTRSKAMILEKKLKNLGRNRTITFISKYAEGLNYCDQANRILENFGIRVPDD